MGKLAFAVIIGTIASVGYVSADAITYTEWVHVMEIING